MNKKTFTMADRFNGGYESPTVTVSEISAEGVLCVSQGSIEEWKEGNIFTWDE